MRNAAIGAEDVPLWIAQRVSDPEIYAREAARGLDVMPELFGAGGLSHGHAGPAILLAAAHQLTGEAEYRKAAHEHLRAAVACVSGDQSLHSGAAGVLFAATICSDGGRHYGSLRATLTNDIGARLHAVMKRGAPVSSSLDYDLIGGIAGVVLALGADTPQEVVDHLVWLFGDDRRWAAPLLGGDDPAPCHNVGLAHGSPGVLAALCLADRPVPEEIVRTIARDLIDSAQRRDGGAVWPMAREQRGSYPLIKSWCYGNPGVGAALWSFAEVFDDDTARQEALQALHMVADLPSNDLIFHDNQICHGYAGLALILAQIGKLANDATLLRAGRRLAEQVERSFDPVSKIGYRCFLRNRYVDCHGLLMGATGIALALLTIDDRIDDGWVRCLGLPTRRWHDDLVGRRSRTS
jgi:lantibiotic biosynthesis protein